MRGTYSDFLKENERQSYERHGPGNTLYREGDTLRYEGEALCKKGKHTPSESISQVKEYNKVIGVAQEFAKRKLRHNKCHDNDKISP